MMETPRILIVDDEPLIRESLEEIITAEGYNVFTADCAKSALLITDKDRIDVVLLDMVLPDMDGLEVMKVLNERNFEGKVLFMTAYSTVSSAVNAMKLGAYDYLIKPCNNDEIKSRIRDILDANALGIRNQILREELRNRYGLCSIISNNDKMEQVFTLLITAAPTKATVLITGETGTGKELVAQALHGLSPRRDKPLVKIDCASLPTEVLESELFGHEKGAFTNAIYERKGRVEQADTGTLFLDEIGCLPLELQGKLLRVIQEREFERIGSNKTIKVDIRIIAATNVHLEKSVEQGLFRKDLYYRLNVLNICLPPLSERKDDIALLVSHFIALYNGLIGKSIKGISDEALDILLRYSWPGNIRELKNYIERAVLLEHSEQITPASLPAMVARPSDEELEIQTGYFREQVMDFEKKLVENALKACRGKKKEAATMLGLSPRLLSYYLAKYQL